MVRTEGPIMRHARLKVTSTRYPNVERRSSVLLKPGVFLGSSPLGDLLSVRGVKVELITPKGHKLDPFQLERKTPEEVDALALKVDRLMAEARKAWTIDPNLMFCLTDLGSMLPVRGVRIQMRTPLGRHLEVQRLGRMTSKDIRALAARVDGLTNVVHTPAFLRSSGRIVSIARDAARQIAFKLGLGNVIDFDHVGIQTDTPARFTQVLAQLQQHNMKKIRVIDRHGRRVFIVTVDIPNHGRVSAEIMAPKPDRAYERGAKLAHVAFAVDADKLAQLLDSGRIAPAKGPIQANGYAWRCEKEPFRHQAGKGELRGFKLYALIPDQDRQIKVAIQFRSEPLDLA